MRENATRLRTCKKNVEAEGRISPYAEEVRTKGLEFRA